MVNVVIICNSDHWK